MSCPEAKGNPWDKVIFVWEKSTLSWQLLSAACEWWLNMLLVCQDELNRVYFDMNMESRFWLRGAVNLFDLQSSELPQSITLLVRFWVELIVLLVVGVDLVNWSLSFISREFPVPSSIYSTSNKKDVVAFKWYRSIRRHREATQLVSLRVSSC